MTFKSKNIMHVLYILHKCCDIFISNFVLKGLTVFCNKKINANKHEQFKVRSDLSIEYKMLD